jgi:hypothetical protein
MWSTAVLFQTHFFDRWAEAAFRRLSAHAPPNFEHVVLLHLPAGAPVPERVKRYAHHIVRTPELRQLPYPVKAGGPNWDLWAGGHTDLIPMHFWRNHPRHDRYWMIEYDVRFSGPWRRFFAVFEEDDTDLLAPMLRRRRDCPEWYNWFMLTSPNAPLDDMRSLSSFMPIFRASGRLMQEMDEAYRRGWGGHLESTFATIAMARGLSIADMGGDGEFTPEAYRGRVYTGTVRDTYHAPGTLIFKPTLFRTGSRPDMLWHPVKPFRASHELRQDMRAGRRAIGHFLRTRAPRLLPARWREPGCFTERRAAPTS